MEWYHARCQANPCHAWEILRVWYVSVHPFIQPSVRTKSFVVVLGNTMEGLMSFKLLLFLEYLALW